jgi:hypothetical protein
MAVGQANGWCSHLLGEMVFLPGLLSENHSRIQNLQTGIIYNSFN